MRVSLLEISCRIHTLAAHIQRDSSLIYKRKVFIAAAIHMKFSGDLTQDPQDHTQQLEKSGIIVLQLGFIKVDI